jgi:hypothetical protein
MPADRWRIAWPGGSNQLDRRVNKMSRYSDDPVRHIVTFRVNREEKKLLEHLAKQSGRTVSDFVRRHLNLLTKS